jgi:bacillithiol system protein YtxJ
MAWLPLESLSQLDSLDELSDSQTIVLFKHSTRCSISNMVLNRLDRSKPQDINNMYLLDLLNYREVSNKIAERYQVHHESPQVLVIKNRECIFTESQGSIMWDEINEELISH